MELILPLIVTFFVLLLVNGRTETKVLRKSFLFANHSKICALDITHIYSFSDLPLRPDCDVGGLTNGTTTIFRLDINVASDEMYFSIEETIYRQKFYQKATSLYTANRYITDLAFDWITTELYWTEALSNTIYKAPLPSHGNSQIITPSSAVTSLSKPVSISINPLERVLFAITTDGYLQEIERFSLDNSTNTVLRTRVFRRAKYLTYNRPKNRLYWTDRTSVSSITSTGQDVKIHHILEGFPLGIAVYKDYVIWLQSSPDQTVMVVKNFDSEEPQHSIPLQHDLSPGAFVIYDKNIQPRNDSCFEDNSGCQQICVVDGYFPKCKCRIGYILNADNVSCSHDPIDVDYFLTTDQFNNRLYKVLNSTKIEAVDTGAIIPVSVVFDYNRNVIVWIDKIGKSIKSITNDGNEEKTLITEDTTPTSIDIDQSTSNIYYTTRNNIKVLSVGIWTERTLISRLLQPNHIKLHPRLGKMVWIENNNGKPTIREAFMDGSNVGVVVPYSETEIKSPSSLTIDTEDNRIIWSDDELDSIKTVSLVNTADRKTLLSNTGEYPVAVDVIGEYVYYIDKGQRSVKKIRKNDGTNAQVEFSSELFGRLSSFVKVTTKRISKHLLCKDKNGHCSRLCLPRGNNQRLCQCSDYVQIKKDGKTCVGDIQCPKVHGAAIINEQCSRYPDVSCKYVCTDGYSKSSNVEIVSCLPNGGWNVSSNILCTRILCPEKFKNGQVSDRCTRYIGSICDVTCYGEYISDNSSISCHDNGQWNMEVSNICKLDSGMTDKSTDTWTMGAVIGIAAGGVIIVVTLITVLIVCILHRVQEKKTNTQPAIQMVDISPLNGLPNYYSSNHRNEERDYNFIPDDNIYTHNMNVAKVLSESTFPRDENDPPPAYHDIFGAERGYNMMVVTNNSNMIKEASMSRHFSHC